MGANVTSWASNHSLGQPKMAKDYGWDPGGIIFTMYICTDSDTMDKSNGKILLLYKMKFSYKVSKNNSAFDSFSI